MKIDVVADVACVCGEGPIWHAAEQKLYWTDVPTGRLYCFDPASGTHDVVLEDRMVGGLTVQADGSLLLFRDGGNVVAWRHGQLHDVVSKLPNERLFNDCVADPVGRVFAGTLPVGGGQADKGEPEHMGRLYRFEPDGRREIVRHGVACSNGLGFSNDRRTLYYTDSDTYCIHAFDYYELSGAIRNCRLFKRVKPPKKPDGLTVDTEDHVWSAHWEGGQVTRYRPDGKKADKVRLPVPLVTSLAFGGEDLDELYVTSAGGDKRDSAGRYAGSLFRVTGLNVRGRPEFVSRLGL